MSGVVHHQYIAKFIDITYPYFHHMINELFVKTLEMNKVHKELLREFQGNLKGISKYSKEDQDQLYTNLIGFCKLNGIDKFIKSLLNMITQNSEIPRIKLSSTEFIYSVYLNIARRLWKEPFLFYNKRLTKKEIQDNYLKVEKIIQKTIKTSFSDLIMIDVNEENHTGGKNEDVNEDNSDNEDDDSDDEEDDSDSDDDEDDSDDDEDDDESDKDGESAKVEQVNKSEGNEGDRIVNANDEESSDDE